MKWSIPLYLYAGNHGSKKFNLANPTQQITSDIDFPILIIHGNKDGLVPYENMVFLKSKIDENLLKCITIDKGSHFIIFKNYELIQKELLAILEKME
jgi:pimeloyl-ACP methyl ester carboxylesterase